MRDWQKSRTIFGPLVAHGGAGLELGDRPIRRGLAVDPYVSSPRRIPRSSGGQAWLKARMGMVTLGAVAVSEAASMWQRPSKIPPGSITRQGECTSPVTTPLA